LRINCDLVVVIGDTNLEIENKELREQIAEYKRENEYLRRELAQLKRLIFGAKSERFISSDQIHYLHKCARKINHWKI